MTLITAVALVGIKFFGGAHMDMADYAQYLIGTKYVWGGSSVEQGFDCSGLVNELWASQGTKPKGRFSAQEIHTMLTTGDAAKARQCVMSDGCASGVKKNSLLFFGEDTNKITHIAIAVNDTQMIEAGGEGREATTLGMVRLRAISNRSDLVAAIVMDEYLAR